MDEPYWASQLRKERRIKRRQLINDYNRGQIELTPDIIREIYEAQLKELSDRDGSFVACICTACAPSIGEGHLESNQRSLNG